jgi:L-ascorbate metabolism protein UlaG (beta-lactamase superfamily)
VQTQHFTARGLFDRQKSLWGGYKIQSRGRRIYFAGDTGCSTHFSEIKTRLGSPNIAMLGRAIRQDAREVDLHVR